MRPIPLPSIVAAVIVLCSLSGCEKKAKEDEDAKRADAKVEAVRHENNVRQLNMVREEIGRRVIDSFLIDEAKRRIADVEYFAPQGRWEANFDHPDYVEWDFSGTISPKNDVLGAYQVEMQVRQPIDEDFDGSLAETRETLGLPTPPENPEAAWEVVAFVNLGVDGLDQPLEIKGIRIGMTKDEVAEALGPLEEFTIAGVKGKSPTNPLILRYGEDGQLDELTFRFETGFESVLDAVKSKYPTLKTDGSTSSIRDKEGSTLYIFIKHPTSTLLLTSKRSQDELRKKAEEKSKDI